MRTVTFLLIILLVPSTIALSQSGMVRIDGQIIGYKGTKRIDYCISSTRGSGNNGSVQPDSLGRFTIQKSLSNTEFFFMYYSDNGVTHKCKLILRPGEYYSFFSDGYDSKKWDTHYTPDIYTWKKSDGDPLAFFKMNSEQMYFNRIDNGTSGSLYHDNWDLYKPDVLLDILHSRIRAQDSVFLNLLEEGIIDKEFYEIAKLNIKYTQAYRLAQTISDTWQLARRFGIEDSVITKKLYEIYPKIFEQYPVKGVKMEYLLCFDSYIDLYLRFIADYHDGTFKPQIWKGVNFMELMPMAKEVLSEEAYKDYMMMKTMSNVASLDLKANQHVKDFFNEYPDMKNTPGGEFLEDVLIPNHEEFMKLVNAEMSDNMIILDKYGIEMVYIAYEYEINRDQWEAFIKAYNLTGYHFISNNEFKSDIEKYAGMIVDRSGNVVEPNAYLPSQGEKLYDQIKEKLKL